MSNLEDFGSKLNFFLWEDFPSQILNKFIKDPIGKKFISGPDCVFILANNKFYMLTNNDIFSKKYDNSNFEPKDIRILAQTLDIYYPKDSQVVILYGINELNKKKCIVVYDFLQDLIITTFFLPPEYSDQNPRFIRGNTNRDNIISHILLCYLNTILIFKGSFINQEIKLQTIDLSKNTILLLQFGKIEFINSDINQESPKTIHDVLYLITKNKKIIFQIFLQDEFNSNSKPIKSDLKFIPSRCTLLNSDTICFEITNQSDSSILVTKFAVSVFNQTPRIIESFSINYKLPNELTLLRGFNHYIITFDKQKMLCVYDYKYIPDLTKDDYKINPKDDDKNSSESEKKNQSQIEIPKKKITTDDYENDSELENENQSQIKISKEKIICVLKIQCKFFIKFIFYHMSKVFLLKANTANYTLSVLFEDKPSNIINKLVSSNKYFEYAKQHALLLSMPPSEIADIEWKQANFIFNNPEFDETTRTERSMDHFIETIGYKESSNVIQLYMDYKEETLIRYLWGDHKEPSEKSIIMNPKIGSLEHRKLLISICVKLYSEKKTQLIINNSEKKESLPLEILNYIKDPENKQYEDCRDSLIDAFLSMDLPDEAIKLAEDTHDYERTLKLLFDIKNNNDKAFSKIIEVLFEKEDISTKDRMKYLTEYARELFYSSDIQGIKQFIQNIAEFSCSLIQSGEDKYIEQICLLFVPQLSSVRSQLKASDSNPDLSKSQQDSDDITSSDAEHETMEINDRTRMSILFIDFYTIVIEELSQEKKGSSKIEYPSILNDVYIQHLIILCRYKYFLHPDINEETDELFLKLKKALAEDNYMIDTTILNIIDLPDENYKFKLLKYICLSHEKYASNLIHLVSIFNRINDDEISSAIFTLCKDFGKNNPNLYLEAIAEFIQQGRCIDTIPELLALSSEFIPLPDIITYILQFEQYMDNRKLNLSLIKKYVVDWMNAMLEYEQQLKELVQKQDQELEEIRTKQYSIKEMKDIRDEYKKMVENAAKQPNISDSEDKIKLNLKFKRPFSLVPNYNPRQILESNDENKNSAKNDKNDKLKRGTTMPNGLLIELEAGVLVDGLDSADMKAKQHFTPEADKMITEFDKMLEILDQ